MNLKKLDKQTSTLGFLISNGESTKDSFVRVFKSGNLNCLLKVNPEEATVTVSNQEGKEFKIYLFNIKEDVKQAGNSFDKSEMKKVENLIIRTFNKIKNFIPEPAAA